MSDPSLSITPRRLIAPILGVGLVIVAASLLGHGTPAVPVGPPWRLHGPNLGLLVRASPAVQAHLGAVLAALGLGTVLMAGRTGRTPHRILGWAFVVLMMAAAGASLFIHGINPRGFSLLHLLSGWTLIVLPVAVMAARRHRVRFHARSMTGLYLGGLIAAGLFALLPGRLLWQVFFG